ncbi:hypothetical protein [Bradyrhizobium sp. UFLA05-112]
MTDEPHDTDPDVLRDRLLMQAERGEITGERAETEAAAHGLESFERKPELPRFDPKLKSHWSIVMAVAWIAWRHFELVREQDPEFCSECFHWISRELKERPKDVEPVKRIGYFLEARSAPTLSRLALLDGVLRVRGNVPLTAKMTIQDAEAALWRALSEGHLMAEGVDADGAVVEVPSRAWAHLRLFNDSGRETLRYVHSRTEPFTAVTLRRSDLLRLWPDPPVTAKTATGCREWLIREMQASPAASLKSKDEFFRIANQKFGISRRSFDTAWKMAIEITGADWSAAGRRSKKSNHRAN